MAFDAGMVSAVVYELNHLICGGRIDKIYQPEKDEITLMIRGAHETLRLLISAGNRHPRIQISYHSKENPQSAPLFCMLLRKHLSGARITAVHQPGFERIVVIECEGRDEMGFSCKRRIIAEIMGKYSNIILTDGEGRIISAIKTVDFTTSQKRQVLPGMMYEMPPAQNKRNPLTETAEMFFSSIKEARGDVQAEKWIAETYGGISRLISREIAWRTSGSADVALDSCDPTALWAAFSLVVDTIRKGSFVPTLLISQDGMPAEYSFMEIKQYENIWNSERLESIGMLLDRYFYERDRAERIHQRAADLLKLLTAAENRLTKKIVNQQQEIAACAEKDIFRKYGDLITANIYQLRRGANCALLPDYTVEDCAPVEVPLDPRLTPSQNAQRYYKRYNKAKTAESELSRQIELAKHELTYLSSVNDAIDKAESETDLAEIRSELYQSGYASRMKQYKEQKNRRSQPLAFRTTNGYKVLCGKNNLQNEYITHKLASKNDMWFHIKNSPGSHVVMFCGDSETEPPEIDFTEAAMIAAVYSKTSEAKHVPIDYTQVRNLKKPAGAKPGMVIYHTNWTAYVTPDREAVDRMRIIQ